MNAQTWLQNSREANEGSAPTYAMSYPQMGARASDLTVNELTWVIATLKEAMRVEDQFGSDSPEVLASIARAEAIQKPMLADCEAALEAKSEDGA